MPRWQMEVVELSDRAGGTEMVLQGEKRGERTKPVAEGDRFTFASESKIRYKAWRRGGKIGTIPELYWARN